MTGAAFLTTVGSGGVAWPILVFVYAQLEQIFLLYCIDCAPRLAGKTGGVSV